MANCKFGTDTAALSARSRTDKSQMKRCRESTSGLTVDEYAGREVRHVRPAVPPRVLQRARVRTRPAALGTDGWFHGTTLDRFSSMFYSINEPRRAPLETSGIRGATVRAAPCPCRCVSARTPQIVVIGPHVGFGGHPRYRHSISLMRWLTVASRPRCFSNCKRPTNTGILYLSAVTYCSNIRTDPRWLPFLRDLGVFPEQLAAIKFDVKVPK